MAKRLFDLITAVLALALLSPLFLCVGLAIKMTSPGPVFYRQIRVGRRGTLFKIIKFRTMAPSGSNAPQITVAGDARITPIGSWMRRFKIDELPQLINVIVGDMSFVGPRPEVPEYVALWPESARDVVLSVRPGITDLASIEFRDEAAFLARYPDPEAAYRSIVIPRKLELCLTYVRTRTFARDVTLILKTIMLIGR